MRVAEDGGREARPGGALLLRPCASYPIRPSRETARADAPARVRWSDIPSPAGRLGRRRKPTSWPE